MFGFIHFVLNPNPGCLSVEEEKESYWLSSQWVIFSSHKLSRARLKDYGCTSPTALETLKQLIKYNCHIYSQFYILTIFEKYDGLLCDANT